MDINKRSKTPSVMSFQKLENNHDFNWHRLEILARESQVI